MPFRSTPALRRTTFALVAVPLSLGTLAACGGSDDSQQNADPSAPVSTTSDQQAGQKQCRADVEVTGQDAGVANISWSSKAQVILPGSSQSSGPKAIYLSTNDKNQLSLYSAGTNFDPSATLALGKTTYSSAGGDTSSIDAASDGTKATADLDLADVNGKTAHVKASFTCSQNDVKNFSSGSGQSSPSAAPKGKK